VSCLSKVARGTLARSQVVRVQDRARVEKHIGAIFLKLGPTDPSDVARRVKAALIYLAEHTTG
jgi:hypothetical protein